MENSMETKIPRFARDDNTLSFRHSLSFRPKGEILRSLP